MMQFFVLGKTSSNDYATHFAMMEPNNMGDPPRCPVCGDYTSGMMQWLPPYRATIIATFSKLGDVTARFCHTCLVSARFRRAWEERRLCGIDEFTPLERLRVRPARLAKPGLTYYVIKPGRGPRVDFAHSNFKYKGTITCNYCQTIPVFESVRGFAIEPGSWNGEDIFCPWGFSGTLVVSDRVRQLRDDYDLKNVELTPIEEYVFPPDHGGSDEDD